MSVQVQGVAELVGKLNRLASMNGAKRGIAAGATLLKDKVQQYPEQTHDRMAFVSDKQRKFFFASLRDGTLGVPYKRTGKLGQGWTVDFDNGGLSATVGNGTSYAGLVQGHGLQAGFHQNNWQTEEEVAKAWGPTVVRGIEDEIRADING